jgi:hypothetical protein
MDSLCAVTQSDSCQYLTKNRTSAAMQSLHEVLDLIGKFGRGKSSQSRTKNGQNDPEAEAGCRSRLLRHLQTATCNLLP